MQLLKSISTLPFYNALISSVICLCNASINNGYGFRFFTFCIYCKVNNTLKISVFEKIYDGLCAVIVAYDIAKIYIWKQITTLCLLYLLSTAIYCFVTLSALEYNLYSLPPLPKLGSLSFLS